MLREKFMPFGEWLPDQPDLGNATTVARNVIPQAASYRNAKALSGIASPLNNPALGSVWAKNEAGTFFNFAGDVSALYRLVGSTFSNVSKVGGYSASSWEFVVWGDRIIAAGIEDPMQYFDMASSALFADLPGSPPKAKHIASVRDFVVAGNVDEGGTVYPNRLRWSGFNNSETWTSSQATQSDFQDLQGRGGAIQKIVPGETGLVLQEHSIRRMSYVGPPLIFRIDEIERDRGCFAPNSVVWTGATVYYYSHDGFYMKVGDTLSQPIGTEKIDEWFKNDFNFSDINALRGAVDRRNKLIAWCYPSNEIGANRVLIYRWDIKRWAYIDQPATLLLENISAGYTLDGLDVILGDIDMDSINVDSDAYLGGELALAAFDDQNRLSTFSGADLAMQLETGELADLSRISVKSILPVTDGTASVCVGTRDTQKDNFNYGLPSTVNAKGEIDARSSAKHHRFKAEISDGCDHAQGLNVFYRKEGRR